MLSSENGCCLVGIGRGVVMGVRRGGGGAVNSLDKLRTPERKISGRSLDTFRFIKILKGDACNSLAFISRSICVYQ